MAKKKITYSYKFTGSSTRIFPTILDNNSKILVANPGDIVNLLEPTEHVFLEPYNSNEDVKESEELVETPNSVEIPEGE